MHDLSSVSLCLCFQFRLLFCWLRLSVLLSLSVSQSLFPVQPASFAGLVVCLYISLYFCLCLSLSLCLYLLLLLLLRRSTAVQVRSSVRLMSQYQPSGRGPLPSPTDWSPDQLHAAMFAEVSGIFWAGLKDVVWGLVSLSALTQTRI